MTYWMLDDDQVRDLLDILLDVAHSNKCAFEGAMKANRELTDALNNAKRALANKSDEQRVEE